MTRLCEFAVTTLSRLVQSDSRDSAIGDLTELNLGFWRSVREVCGLIAREQAPHWRDWRPWLALLGVAGLIGVQLNFQADGLVFGVSLYARTYRKYGVLFQSGLSPTEELIRGLSNAIAVAVWSWTAGFTFISLARKTAAVTGILLCLGWFGWNGFVLTMLRHVLSKWDIAFLCIPWVLFFLPAAWGASRGFRHGSLSNSQAHTLHGVTVVLIALMTWTSGWPDMGLERWSEGAIHGGTPWFQRLLPFLLLSSPAAWIAVNANLRRWEQ